MPAWIVTLFPWLARACVLCPPFVWAWKKIVTYFKQR